MTTLTRDEIIVVLQKLNIPGVTMYQKEGIQQACEMLKAGDIEWQPFNVNNNVKFKLTESGRRILQEKRDELNKFLGDLGAKTRILDGPKPDENGYITNQLWCVMKDFGEHITMGFNPPFETEILIQWKAPT